MNIGLFQSFALRRMPGSAFLPRSPLGVFLNVNVSRKISLEMEYQRNALSYQNGADEPITNESFFDTLYKRDWSASLAFNYHLQPIHERFMPFVGLGAGQYYIYDSKNRIREARGNPQQGDIDYDMRRYFKRPGFFGTFGVKFNANPRTTFFLNGKCSILFDDEHSFIALPCNYSDFYNITTGIRYSIN